MPGQIEFIGYCPQPLLKEFLEPPAAKDLGDKACWSSWSATGSSACP